MSERKLAGRCGIYCGACTIYRAYKEGGELRKEVADQLQVEPEEIACEGCGGPVEKMWRNCRRCEVAVCLDSKHLRYCYECPDFDIAVCDKHQFLVEFTAKRGERIRVAELAFKKGRMDEWLEEQDRRWRCHRCGRPVTWYQEMCRHCGTMLKGGPEQEEKEKG